MTCIHKAERWQGAGQQFLGKCYLKSFQIVVPKFYKHIHYLLKAGEDAIGLLEQIRGFNQNDFEEHATTPGEKGELWFSLSWSKEWGMSLEQVLKAYRLYVCDWHPIKVYFQLKLDYGRHRKPLPMTTQDLTLCSQMTCYHQ